MKEFIYFFKHLNVDGVKIGRTSGESVDHRFATFKIYSPYGAKILGYYQCSDCIDEEKRLHEKYKKYRMSGEFFNITEADVQNELLEQIPNYNLLISEINHYNIDLPLLRKAIERQKNTIIKTDFDKLLSVLPDTFTTTQAKNACNNLGFSLRFFHSSIRSSKAINKIIKIGYGIYKKK